MNNILTSIILVILSSSCLYAEPSIGVLYSGDDWDGIAPSGGKNSLPLEVDPSNLVARADQQWYKKGVEGAAVASDSCTLYNYTPPPGVTGGAALRVGYITAAGTLSSYIALTNAVWEFGTRYTLKVRHRIADVNGSVVDSSAVGTLMMKLGYVDDAGALVFPGTLETLDIDTSTWSTSELGIDGVAAIGGGIGRPIVIQLAHTTGNSANHWTWVDSVVLESIPDTLAYRSTDWDGIAPVGEKITLPAEPDPSNLVARADQKWYKGDAEGAIVASDSCTLSKFIPPPGVSGGAALRVGYITAAWSLTSYIALTNASWNPESHYTLKVRHRIADINGSVADASAVGSLRMRLGYVDDLGELNFVANINTLDIDTSAWSTSVLSARGADAAAGAGRPIVIQLLHTTDNSANHFTWVDSVTLEESFGIEAQLPIGRGVWMWGKSDEPWGSLNILGDPVKEAGTIREFQEWNIKRVYGAYSEMTATSPETVAAWNQRLYDAGISSELLVSGTGVVFPENRERFFMSIYDKLIVFNRSRIAMSERFQRLHVDVEPHGAEPTWSTLTGSERRVRLQQLLDMYRELRNFLDINGAAHVQVDADLPVWFEDMDSGWANDADRIQWFTELGVYVDGISMMAYASANLTTIWNSVSWEFVNFPGAEKRIGLEATIGPNLKWKSFDLFMAGAETLEAEHGSSIGVDIHSLVLFGPSVPPSSTTIGVPYVSGGALVLPITGFRPNQTNFLEQCSNLISNDWISVGEFVSWDIATNWIESTSSTQAFYRVLSN